MLSQPDSGCSNGTITRLSTSSASYIAVLVWVSLNDSGLISNEYRKEP